MASSGSYDFSLTRDNIIDLAYCQIGVNGEGVAASTAQVTAAGYLLNMIVKLRAADGMPLWVMRRGTVLPFTGTNTINTDSHVVTHYDTTTLTAALAISGTTLTVSSITGFTNADQIGIALNDGTVFWTTINGVPAGSSIVITAGPTVAASSGNRVYGYTAASERVQKPLRIVDANIAVTSSGQSWPIFIVPQTDYYNLSNKASTGIPNTLYYSLEPSSLTAIETNGQINIWPRFYGGLNVIEFTYQRQMQDFDATGDTPDFPQAFYLPLMLELASLLGPRYGVPIEERRALQTEAQHYLDEALYTIAPEGSFVISPNYNGR